MSQVKVLNKEITFSTMGEIQFLDLSDKIRELVIESGVKNGIAHIFAPHATGILILTENDPELLTDIEQLLENLAPKDGDYNHPSNAHAHLRSIIFQPDKTLPIVDGKIEFGTWQSLMFIETDVYPRNRTVRVQIMGEA